MYRYFICPRHITYVDDSTDSIVTICLNLNMYLIISGRCNSAAILLRQMSESIQDAHLLSRNTGAPRS